MKRVLIVLIFLVIDLSKITIAGFGKSKADSTNLVCQCAKDDSVRFKEYQYREALKYAPVFWFADQEEYLPIVPFFSAFDGHDNNPDTTKATMRIDLGDSVEIAPKIFSEKHGNFVSWDTLKEWYDLLSLPEKRKLVTILYKIETTNSVKLKTILYSDEQFYHRLDATTIHYLEEFDKNKNTLFVYKYYLYYIRDLGLQGHPEDIERVFIFIPPDRSFGIAVGAGHSGFVSNNVLFYKPKEPKKSLDEWHPYILVELGGHSNAPDFNENGNFDLGVDANWHVENLWGTRDIQAVSGLGAIGTYAGWMNFARVKTDTSSKIFYPPSNIQNRKSPYCYRFMPVEILKKLDDKLKERTSLEKTKVVDHKEHEKTQKNHDKKASSKVELHLEETIKACAVNDKECQDTENTITDLLEKMRPPFQRPFLATQEENFEHLLLWRKGLLVKQDLRPRKLYRKLYSGFAFWGNTAIEQLFSEPRYPYPEWRIAYMFFPRFNPGSKFFDGSIELQAGFTGPRADLDGPDSEVLAKNLSLSLVYDTYYTRIESCLSFFANYSFRFDKNEHVWGAGISFVPPYNPPLQPKNILRIFRLRLGFGYMPFGHMLLGERFLLQMGIGIHLRYIPVSNDEYMIQETKKHKIWEQDDYEKKKSAQIFKLSLFRPRHPWGFGIWSGWANWKYRFPTEELQISWIVPAWDAFPLKLDGILEIHAGRRYPINKLNDERGWTLGLYYDRFYAAHLPSWYLNIGWVRSTPSYYSLGGGFSAAIPINLYLNRFLHAHLFRMRLGLRADVNRETHFLTQHRIEFQLGLQH